MTHGNCGDTWFQILFCSKNRNIYKLASIFIRNSNDLVLILPRFVLTLLRNTVSSATFFRLTWEDWGFSKSTYSGCKHAPKKAALWAKERSREQWRQLPQISFLQRSWRRILIRCMDRSLKLSAITVTITSAVMVSMLTKMLVLWFLLLLRWPLFLLVGFSSIPFLVCHS